MQAKQFKLWEELKQKYRQMHYNNSIQNKTKQKNKKPHNRKKTTQQSNNNKQQTSNKTQAEAEAIQIMRDLSSNTMQHLAESSINFFLHILSFHKHDFKQNKKTKQKETKRNKKKQKKQQQTSNNTQTKEIFNVTGTLATIQCNTLLRSNTHS